MSYGINDFIKRIEHVLTGNKYICQFVPIGERLINLVNGTNKITKDEKLEKIFKSGIDNIGILAKSFAIPQFTHNFAMLKSHGTTIPATPNAMNRSDIQFEIMNTGGEWHGIKKLGELYYSPYTGFYGYFSDILFNIIVTEFEANGKAIMSHHFINCVLLDYGSISFSYDDASALETFSINVSFTDYYINYDSNDPMKDVTYQGGWVV